MRPNFRNLTEPIARGPWSGRPGLRFGRLGELEFVNPERCRDRAASGALDGNGVIQTGPRKVAAEPGKDGLIHANLFGKRAPGNAVGVEVMLEFVHAGQFA